jgi:CDP-diacylglycerol---glycerol-3-phosphate 3-phosphatidyltransferase
MLTSYVRARAEGLGLFCKFGIMHRPERITFLATAAILGGIIDRLIGTQFLPMRAALILIAVLANITVLQRVIHVRRKLTSQL